MDLNALTVSDTDALPSRARSAFNPFVDYLRASWEQGGKGKAVTVSATDVPEVANLVRAASDTLGLGANLGYVTAKGVACRLVRQPTGRTKISEKTGKAVDITRAVLVTKGDNQEVKTGNVTVTFVAKERTDKSRKSNDATE